MKPVMNKGSRYDDANGFSHFFRDCETVRSPFAFSAFFLTGIVDREEGPLLRICHGGDGTPASSVESHMA